MEPTTTDFGDIIATIGFGNFQKWLMLCTSITCLFADFAIFVQVFSDATVPYRCRPDRAGGDAGAQPGRVTPDPVTQSYWHEGDDPCVVARNASLLQLLQQDGNASRTAWPTTLAAAAGVEELGNGSYSQGPCTSGWIYDTSQHSSTIVTEFDLVCEWSWLVKMSQSLFMLGTTLGSVGGPLSDKYGRKTLLIVAMIWQFLCGMGCVFSPNIVTYMVFRFGMGISVPFILGNPTVLVMEWCGASVRTMAAVMPQGLRGIGQVLLATLAYFIRDWRKFQLAAVIAPLLGLVIYSSIVPESARWLYVKGRHDASRQLMVRAAKQNGITLPAHMLDTLSIEKKNSQTSALDFFRTVHMRRVTLIILYLWLVVGMSYYKLSLTSEGFGLDIYLTQVIFGLIESPARFCLPWFLEGFGRRPTMFTTQVFGGVACIILALIPAELRVVTTVIAVLVKTCMGCAFAVLFIYSTELFPTSHRQNGLGMAAVSGSVGGILAPMVSMLERYHHIMPLTLVGFAVLLSSLFCLWLPETRNAKLPDVLPTNEEKPAQKAKVKTGIVQNGGADSGSSSINVFTRL